MVDNQIETIKGGGGAREIRLNLVGLSHDLSLPLVTLFVYQISRSTRGASPCFDATSSDC